MTIAKFVAVTVVAYATIWTTVYAVFMKFDFSFFAEYFLLAWTGPGEIPAYIQFLSVTITFLTMAGVVSWKLIASKIRKEWQQGSN